MYEYNEETADVIETAADAGKRERFGFDYVSARKRSDRFDALSSDLRIGRASKAARRAGKRSERASAIRNAWREI